MPVSPPRRGLLLAAMLFGASACGADESDSAPPEADAAPPAVDADVPTPDATLEPYSDWPDPTTVFPYVYSPDPDLPPYGHARWETETWESNDVTQTALYLRKLIEHYTTAEPEVMQHFAATGPTLPALAEGLVLTFAGDILWIGENWNAFAVPVAPYITGDLRIGNLETAASPDHPVQKMGLPVRFNADPAIFDALPFDLLQLNNNHSLDADDEGLTATKAEAERRGFVTTGVDTHATVDVKGSRIAFLSYTWGVNRRDLTSTHDLFVVPFGHLEPRATLDRIQTEIAGARADGAEYVVVLLHWGYEFEHFPAPHFLQMAREIVAFGADVLAAQGPHVVQPAELCYVNHPEVVPGIGTCSVRSQAPGDDRARRAAIFYSLGNFTNDTPDRIEVETGILGRVSLDGDVTGMAYTPVVLRQDPVRVEAADLAAGADEEVRGEIERLERHLGAGWRLRAEAIVNGEMP